MVSIIKKIKNRRPYYYAVESGRVNGKPRIIWQKYLGTVDDILMRADSAHSEVKAIEIFEAGGIAAMLKMIERIKLIEIIDEIIPKRKQGPSTGQFIALTILNRIFAPCSKTQISDWYKETILARLWKHHPDSFTSQNFWNHMDLISEEQMDEIQNKISLQVKQEFTLNPSVLLYDTTNFFTYIATGNKRNTIARRGKSKVKRNDLRQIGLALLVTKDFQIPLFHRVYEGNAPDKGLFPTVANEIKKFNDDFFGSNNESTLVFDKGNISQEAMEQLFFSRQHYVCAIPRNTPTGNDLFKTDIKKMKSVPGLAGTKAFSCDVNIWQKKHKAVLAYSESYFSAQLTELSDRLQKCQQKLQDLQIKLLKKPNIKQTLKQVQDQVRAIISSDYIKEIIEVSVTEHNKQIHISYEINKEKMFYVTTQLLGRTLIISSRFEWTEEQIISAYRGQNNIETCFKQMKHQEYLHWQPSFHWTDQKIKVHGLYCVLALLITSLTHKVVSEKGIDISVPEMLNELSKIREVILFDSEKDDNRKKGKLSLSRMTPIQKKLAEATDLIQITQMGNTKRKNQKPS